MRIVHIRVEQPLPQGGRFLGVEVGRRARRRRAVLIRRVGMACCYRQATRFAPPRGIVRLAQAVKCSDLVLGNCENKLCSFFLGDSRPGAFVV